jgi:hypothetical protein
MMYTETPIIEAVSNRDISDFLPPSETCTPGNYVLKLWEPKKSVADTEVPDLPERRRRSATRLETFHYVKVPKVPQKFPRILGKFRRSSPPKRGGELCCTGNSGTNMSSLKGSTTDKQQRAMAETQAMTRRRGWCPTCRGPLRHPTRLDSCRACWLGFREAWSRRRHVAFHGTWRPDAAGVARGAAIHDAALTYAEAVIVAETAYEARQGVANSTEDTAATSTWLPRVWVGRGRGTNSGNVVWFACSDYAEVKASKTMLAAQLRCEPVDERAA